MTERVRRLWPLATRAPVALIVSVLSVRMMDEWIAFLPSGAFEAFRNDLDLSYGGAATIITLMGIGALVGSAFTVLADTHSRRAIATIGAYGYAASIATFGLGHAVWVLALGSIGIGMFSTALVDAVEVAMVDVAGDDLEPLLARINVGATIGDLSGPVVLATTTALGGSWRVALVGSAVVMAGFATLVAASPLPPPRAPTRPDDASPSPLRATFGLLRLGRVWWAGLLGAGLVALDESYLGFIIAGFEGERGTSRAAAVALGSASVVGAAITSLWLARRTPLWEARRRMTVAAAVMTVTAALFAVLPTVWLPTAAIVVFDGALIGFWLPLQAIALRLVPGRTGSTKAVIGAIEMLGLLIPIGVGVVADRAGLGVGLLAFAAVPAALLLLTLAGPTTQPASSGDRDGRATTPE